LRHTLQPTALLNEAWIRLAQSKTPPVADREQFFRAMAAYVRRHLVDHARRSNADKRGSGEPRADFEEAELSGAIPEPDDTEAERGTAGRLAASRSLNPATEANLSGSM
jgi:ECF sigma factor